MLSPVPWDEKDQRYLWTMVNYIDQHQQQLVSHILLRGDAGHFNKIRCTYDTELGKIAIENLEVFAILWSQTLRETI
jgi:hypothetical protein